MPEIRGGVARILKEITDSFGTSLISKPPHARDDVSTTGHNHVSVVGKGYALVFYGFLRRTITQIGVGVSFRLIPKVGIGVSGHY